MFAFTGLIIFQKARNFHVNCLEELKKNKYERFVNDQLGRASFSVALNIAEGSGKTTVKEKIRYLVIARASLLESVAILNILNERKLLSDADYQQLSLQAAEISKILMKMIQNLKITIP